MNRPACIASLIVLAVTSPAMASEPGNPSTSARFRNQRLTEQAQPAEREAILAVTNAGANVILDESGSVTSVQLEGCLFPDSLLAVLRDLPRMKQLQLGHSKVSNSGLAHLRGLDGLESLTLIQTNIGDEGLKNTSVRPTENGSTSPAQTVNGTSSMASKGAWSRQSTRAAGRITRSSRPTESGCTCRRWDIRRP